MDSHQGKRRYEGHSETGKINHEVPSSSSVRGVFLTLKSQLLQHSFFWLHRFWCFLICFFLITMHCLQFGACAEFFHSFPWVFNLQLQNLPCASQPLPDTQVQGKGARNASQICHFHHFRNQRTSQRTNTFIQIQIPGGFCSRPAQCQGTRPTFWRSQSLLEHGSRNSELSTFLLRLRATWEFLKNSPKNSKNRVVSFFSVAALQNENALTGNLRKRNRGGFFFF